MKAQFKYAFRHSLELRAGALGILVLLNLVFGISGFFGWLNNSMLVTAVVFSSLALTGVFVTNIIANVSSFKSILGAPEGYLCTLTPVKSRSILFARLVSTVCADSIALIAGVGGIIWQSFVLSGLFDYRDAFSTFYFSFADLFSGAVITLLEYSYIMLLIVFGITLKNSVFSGKRGRTLLSLLGVAAAAWALSLLNFALTPFGTVERLWLVYSITLPQSFSGSFALYALVALARNTLLFFACSELLERRMNLS